MCVSMFVSPCVCLSCVGGCVSICASGGRGSCKVSSLLSCRPDMQPTDMHSLLLQPQPRLLQPLPPLTATGTYVVPSVIASLSFRTSTTAPSAWGCPQDWPFPHGLCHAKSCGTASFDHSLPLCHLQLPSSPFQRRPQNFSEYCI